MTDEIQVPDQSYQQPPPPVPPPMQQPPQKSKLPIIIAVVLVVVIVVAALGFFFLAGNNKYAGHALIGTWNIDHVEATYLGYTTNTSMSGTLTFRADGSGSGSVSGSGGGFTWEVVDDHTIRMTDSGTTMTMTYSVVGDTLDLTYSESGMDMTMVCDRA